MTTTSAGIRTTGLGDALAERYLAYALSTIMSRSLPDVRDGLKPVHRRLLYAMRQLRLDPDQGYKKSARVVGDVMGKFHPHGDAAIYEAMVRLAQDFAQRYPLVDGQGNFGNVDGDNAAAMRYTEARLTEVAGLLLEGIDEDAVDFTDTYDGESREPVILPAAFPNLLANGAQGIAVGMATSIPPHNVVELCDALLRLIDRPELGIDELLTLVRGPDFPTGGVLVEKPDNIRDAYLTGKGSFRVRATWNVEKLQNGTWQVVVTEIPYQVQKARLVERLAELIEGRKIAMLADVRDESAEDIRLVLEPRSRRVDPELMMESLFAATPLESRIQLNLNVLDASRTPRVMSLPQALQGFLDHRHEVLIRRKTHRLTRIEERLEVLQGYLVAYLNIDEVIRIIREEDDPKTVMRTRWELTDRQAEAILNMRLRALRKLEEIEIRKEFDRLSDEKAEIEALLKDPDLLWQSVADELSHLRESFGPETELGRRRTAIGGPPPDIEIPPDALTEREPVTVVCSEKGWIRVVKGHGADETGFRFKEGDSLRFLLRAHTTDLLTLVASDGRAYSVQADRLPRGRGHGEPLRLMIDMAEDHDLVALLVHREHARYLIASGDGRGFLVPGSRFGARTRTGRQVMSPADNARVVLCRPAEGDHVAVVGDNRRMLVFPIDELPERSGGKGVILQRYARGSFADATVLSAEEGLSWPMPGGRQRRIRELDQWMGRRGQAGVAVPNGFPRPPRFPGGGA